MPAIECPIPGCRYDTGDVEAVLAAALLNLHATTHAQAQGNAGHNAVKPPPMERPRLVASSAKADWEVFSAKWRSFKAATNLTGDKIVHQLLGCLDNDLASLIYNEHASPESLQETELLELLQKVAVKPENVWITRETSFYEAGSGRTSYQLCSETQGTGSVVRIPGKDKMWRCEL